MLDILHFTFSSPWIFLGTAVLLAITLGVLGEFTKAMIFTVMAMRGRD
jgi:hypothetical protein